MPFHVEQVPRDADFLDIVPCEFAAFQNPPNGLLQVIYPIRGPLPADREVAIRETAKRKRADYQGNPASVWLRAVDRDTGKVAGAAEWQFYDADPYAVVPAVDCVWWPEGEDRDLANHILNQLLAPRFAYLRRPHAFLNNLFTHPDYRRRGIGGMLVDWGVETADAKGVGTYIDATEQGLTLYLKRGFIQGEQVEVTLQGVPETSRRRELEKEVLPITWWPVYRPISGRSPSATDTLPWKA